MTPCQAHNLRGCDARECQAEIRLEDRPAVCGPGTYVLSSAHLALHFDRKRAVAVPCPGSPDPSGDRFTGGAASQSRKER